MVQPTDELETALMNLSILATLIEEELADRHQQPIDMA